MGRFNITLTVFSVSLFNSKILANVYFLPLPQLNLASPTKKMTDSEIDEMLIES